jgi:hypothetical protein
MGSEIKQTLNYPVNPAPHQENATLKECSCCLNSLKTNRKSPRNNWRRRVMLLVLLPVSKNLPEVPGSVELKAVMKRRDLKVDALAKSPVAVQLPGGTLAAYAMLKADASTFETHEVVRKALALLLAEHPKSLALAVFGDDEFKSRAADAAVYAALVNAVPLPSRKSKSAPLLKTVQLFGHQSADGFARVQAPGRRQPAHPQPHRAGTGRTHPGRLSQAHQGAGQSSTAGRSRNSPSTS